MNRVLKLLETKKVGVTIFMRTKIQTINDSARLNQWNLTIQECRNSGVSVRKWCQQNDVSEASYYYYLKKMKNQIKDETRLKNHWLSSTDKMVSVTRMIGVFLMESMAQPHRNIQIF